MKTLAVRTRPEAERLAREDQLAWEIARVAADRVPIDDDVAAMVANRVIDNAAVAAASLDRGPVATARAQAMARPAIRPDASGGPGDGGPGGAVGGRGAALIGLPAARRFQPEWAAWANAVAVRELDFHDTYLAADYSHPGDNIPPLLAVAQHVGADGPALLAAIATAYEVQVALVRGICLHEHRIDHVAHLGPSVAAGLGTLLDLPVETIWRAVNQALHVTTATRQSRKGEISSWKAFAPAHAGKLAIEAVDRAMRGEGAPAPIYEGEDAVIARLLGGPDARYEVRLPAPGAPKRAILETYTKAHSAEYQSQALIDLAIRTGPRILERAGGDWSRVARVRLRTSHHTHQVIGTGANDPQKRDPGASRETLDHSIMYILAVALQDGRWHHVDSYAPERAARPDTVALWHKVETEESAEWTRRYHSPDPAVKAFGGELEVAFDDGSTLVDEIAVADAHPLGARPFDRESYVGKFRTLAEGRVASAERERFLEAAADLAGLGRDGLDALNVEADGALAVNAAPGLL